MITKFEIYDIKKKWREERENLGVKSLKKIYGGREGENRIFHWRPLCATPDNACDVLKYNIFKVFAMLLNTLLKSSVCICNCVRRESRFAIAIKYFWRVFDPKSDWDNAFLVQ